MRIHRSFLKNKRSFDFTSPVRLSQGNAARSTGHRIVAATKGTPVVRPTRIASVENN
jgi:hypothetical protein